MGKMVDMMTETRVVSVGAGLQMRAVEGDDGRRIIAGYGAVFDSLSEDLGGFRERINSQAFSRTLSHGGDVVVTMNHDVNLLLGRTRANTARISVDSVGVMYEVEVPDTQAGRDAWTLAKRGDLYGSSFTFTVPPKGDRWSTSAEGQRTRELLEVRLHELGPVVSPAYLDTTVAARSLADLPKDLSPSDDGTDADGVDDDHRAPHVNIAGRRLRFAR